MDMHDSLLAAINPGKDQGRYPAVTKPALTSAEEPVS